MTSSEFQERTASLANTLYREDFEATLYDLYTRCEATQRARLRHDFRTGALQAPRAWRNPADYFRSDLTREQRFRRLLLQTSIAGLRDDYRDDLCELAYCYHNLMFLGLNADSVFEEVAELSDPEVADFLRGFMHRPPADKSMEAFGLVVVQTPDGPMADRSL